MPTLSVNSSQRCFVQFVSLLNANFVGVGQLIYRVGHYCSWLIFTLILFAGEYINLYRTQRLALKDKFLEKDRLISQLSNEHSRMQVCYFCKSIGRLENVFLFYLLIITCCSNDKLLYHCLLKQCAFTIKYCFSQIVEPLCYLFFTQALFQTL